MSPVTESVIGLLERHGSLVVLAVSLLENLGLPIPALPILVVAGALVVGGPVSLPLTLAAAAAGSLAADLLWFEIGRRKGRAALHVFCKLSLNPDACVGRAERLFRARTTTTILSSKLVPGLNTPASSGSVSGATSCSTPPPAFSGRGSGSGWESRSAQAFSGTSRACSGRS